MSETETEGKLVISSDEAESIAERIAGLDSLDGFRLAKRSRLSLRDVSFDTPDRMLSQKRLELRVRTQDGVELLTLKGPGKPRLSALERFELERPWSAKAFDEVTQLLKAEGVPAAYDEGRPEEGAEAALTSVGLEVLTSRNTRRTAILLEPNADKNIAAELAVDDVLFHVAGREVRHFEVECEAKESGTYRTVAEVLAALGRAFPQLVPFRYSKLEIAFALEDLNSAGRLDSLLAQDSLRPEAYGEIDALLSAGGGY